MPKAQRMIRPGASMDREVQELMRWWQVETYTEIIRMAVHQAWHTEMQRQMQAKRDEEPTR